MTSREISKHFSPMVGFSRASRVITIGIVTVTHPRKGFPIGTLRSIERQSGIKFGGK